jgi:regulatory protein
VRSLRALGGAWRSVRLSRPLEPTRRGTGLIERRKEQAERHAAETDPETVLAAAVRLLEARPRTVSDLRTRLLRASWPRALVEVAIERLTELGFLDDEAYARAWLESRDRGRPRGEHALKTELRRKGVAPAVVEAALEERREETAQDSDVGASADELAAERLLAKRARSMDRLSDERARRQWAYALLARNGFDPDVAARVAGRVGSGGDLRNE